jgi:hypothetical protein
MPTGYTCHILEGCSPREYAIFGLRSMGVLSFMRDDPMDAPIPKEIPLDITYKEECLGRALEEWDRWRLLSTTDKISKVRDLLDRKITETREAKAKSFAEDDQYLAFRQEISSWEVPPELVGFRDFLLSQIDISLNQMGDYYVRAEANLQAWDLEDYATKHEQDLLRNIQYHAEEIQKEIERNRDPKLED